MTQREQEKLAVAIDNIATIKDDMRTIKHILARQEDRFITRLEGKAAAWVIGVAFTILTIWSALRGGK